MQNLDFNLPMTMKRELIYVAVLVAGVALSSCSKEVNEAQDSKTPIALDMQIGQADTRIMWDSGSQMLGTGSGGFEPTDVLGLYVFNTNTATQSIKFRIKDNIDLSPDDVFYFEDLDATNLRFSAFYPKQAVAADVTDTDLGWWKGFAYDASTPTAVATGTAGEEDYVSAEDNQKAAYKAADLLVATGTTSYVRGEAKTVQLYFRHALAKVEINIENIADAGKAFTAEQLNAATVKLTAKPKVGINLIVPCTDDATPLLNCGGEGDATALNPVYYHDTTVGGVPSTRKLFLLGGQEIGTGEFISISLANPVGEGTIDYKYKLSESKMLKGNAKWTFNFKVGLHKIELTDFAISKWDGSDPVDVTPDCEFEY